MITIGYSTRKENKEFQDYIQKTCMFKEVQIIEKINNGEKSLSEVYNEILKESKHDIVVLCHDDLYFETKNWGEKLIKNFEKSDYGILGVAGTKFLDSSTQWWKVPQTMYGVVNHQQGEKKWTSNFSRNPNRIEDVIIVDGLFISLDKRKIKHTFDESIKGFHFYDLGFSLPNFMDGVKVGVMFNIRLTHLSIGETNDQWESNRVEFAEKYKTNLPIDITKTDEQCETFIFVHNQDLIIDFEQSNKFSNLKKYRYVFVGKKEIDKIVDNDKVIIARNYEDNLEDYPLFTSYTGWYILWKYNLITTKYVSLFEYDTILNPYIEQVQSKIFFDEMDMIGYVPFQTTNYHFIDNKDWVENIFPAIKTVYKTDIERQLRNIISQNPNLLWSSTSNTTFKKEVFDEYMKWFYPLVPFLKETRTCGHAHERSISFFYMTKNKKMVLTNGLLQHLQMDSHKTQGHHVDFDANKNKLLFNKI